MNKSPSFVYRHNDGIYINLTNRCPNLCAFCIKTKWNMQYEDYNLNLENKEPSAKEVLRLIYKAVDERPAKEFVFCGYGEPTYKLDELLEIAKDLKNKMAESLIPRATIRLNTVGLGNMIWKKNIVPDLAQNIDDIFISLNAADEKKWKELVRPKEGFEDGFSAVKEFIKECAGKFRRVVVSMVGSQGVDSAQMKTLVESLGAEFYERASLDD